MNTTTTKHIWTDKDDYTCTYEYLKYSLKDNNMKEYTELLNSLSRKLPDISRNSIKCKLQNIKWLCETSNIPDFIRISSWTNASSNNYYFFHLILQLPEIQELISARKSEIEEQKKNAPSLDDIRKLASSYRNKKI